MFIVGRSLELGGIATSVTFSSSSTKSTTASPLKALPASSEPLDALRIVALCPFGSDENRIVIQGRQDHSGICSSFL
jgi:hypothetical protein